MTNRLVSELDSNVKDAIMKNYRIRRSQSHVHVIEKKRTQQLRRLNKEEESYCHEIMKNFSSARNESNRWRKNFVQRHVSTKGELNVEEHRIDNFYRKQIDLWRRQQHQLGNQIPIETDLRKLKEFYNFISSFSMETKKKQAERIIEDIPKKSEMINQSKMDCELNNTLKWASNKFTPMREETTRRDSITTSFLNRRPHYLLSLPTIKTEKEKK
ncbi:hypothetical protein SNEBB_006143 [Seison nebaliae]|nr:hypothetical protein SNEBB_006143 [Seison nebaliae]